MISALDSTNILIGRPNGGVLIIYPDTFGAKAKFISTTSKRLCALSLHMSNIILHLFCVYIPCDVTMVVILMNMLLLSTHSHDPC